MFTDTQLKSLTDPLDPDNVEKRNGAGGKKLSYVEGWHTIDEANRIFGFGNWSRETIVMEPLHAPALVLDPDSPEKGKVVAAFYAKVRITVWSDDGQRSLVREGSGGARGFAKTVGEAMENAIKAAETDATKRALVTFGNAFGLALYDKEQKGVGRAETQCQVAQNGQRTLAPIDEGFRQHEAAPKRPTVSQRALAVRSGVAADVEGMPV